MLKDQCGFCLFFMRFIMLVDLVATLIMRAFVVGYMLYLIFVSIKYVQVPFLSLVIVGAMYEL
jgi:chitin synthase